MLLLLHIHTMNSLAASRHISSDKQLVVHDGHVGRQKRCTGHAAIMPASPCACQATSVKHHTSNELAGHALAPSTTSQSGSVAANRGSQAAHTYSRIHTVMPAAISVCTSCSVPSCTARSMQSMVAPLSCFARKSCSGPQAAFRSRHVRRSCAIAPRCECVKRVSLSCSARSTIICRRGCGSANNLLAIAAACRRLDLFAG